MWRGEFFNCEELCWVGFDTATSDEVAEEFPQAYPEGTFFRIEAQLVLLQKIEDFGEMGQVVACMHAFNDHIIDIGHHCVPEQAFKHFGYHSLKRAPAFVLEAKRHYEVPEDAIQCCLGRFVDIILVHCYLVIALVSVHEIESGMSGGGVDQLIAAGGGRSHSGKHR